MASVTQKDNGTVTKKDNQPLPKKTPTKDTITKDTLYKKKQNTFLDTEKSPSDSAELTKAPMLNKQHGWKKQYSGSVALDIIEIHEYFLQKVGGKYKVHLNHALYKKALDNGFSVDECKVAISGFAENEWAMKHNKAPQFCFGKDFEKFLNEGEELKKTMKEGRPV